jgi:hypothetical protein
MIFFPKFCKKNNIETKKFIKNKQVYEDYSSRVLKNSGFNRTNILDEEDYIMKR